VGDLTSKPTVLIAPGFWHHNFAFSLITYSRRQQCRKRCIT
jgi:hypothetical protein